MSASVEDSVGERILKNVMIRGQDGIMRERLLHTFIHTYIHTSFIHTYTYIQGIFNRSFL